MYVYIYIYCMMQTPKLAMLAKKKRSKQKCLHLTAATVPND